MKMNFVKIVAATVLVSLTVSLAGCASKDTNGVDVIKKAKQIVVGTSGDYPPYEYHAQVNGKDEIVGFDIEIAKQIAKDLGVELVIKDMKFDALLAALDTGKVDFVMAGMTPTPEREQNVDFSKIYYNAVQTLVVRAKDKGTITSVDALNDKLVAVQKGSIQEDIAKNQLPKAKAVALSKISDEMLELKNNKVDALIVEAPVSGAYLIKNSDLALADLKLKTEDSGSAVAIKKGNTALKDAINKSLDKLIADKQIDALVSKATDAVEAK